jgi:type II secretory pathway pseudopilin PulG
MLWALLVLSIVTVLTAALTKQLLLDRRSAEQRRQQAQCLWLARSGVEMAAERLLRDPAGYTGEMIELIPHSQIRIVVQAEKENVVVVTSEARYPTDDSPAVQTLTRRYRRTVEKGVARLEPVTDKERE